MNTPLLLRQHASVTADRLSSASSEAGATSPTVTAAATNVGALTLRASGAQTTTTSYVIRLLAGGYAGTYDTETDGVPSAEIGWRTSTETSSQVRGWIRPSFLVDERKALLTSLTSYPQISPARMTQAGTLGFVAVKAAVFTSLTWQYKSARRSSWTAVTITGTGVSSLISPDWCQLPSGRILVYAGLDSETYARAWYSDDDGATWAAWSTRTNIAIDVDGTCLGAVAVRDAVMVVTGNTETVAMTSAGGVWWSADGGARFTKTSTNTWATPRPVVALNGQAYVVATNAVMTTVYSWPIAYGGGTTDDPTDTSLDVGTASAAALGAAVLDDGTLWAMVGDGLSGGNQASAFSAVVSLDNGASWGAPSGSSAARKILADSKYATGGQYRQFTLGSWRGSLIILARVESSTAAHDDSVDEFWLGLWDSRTEFGQYSNNAGRMTCGYYGDGGCLFPNDTPDTQNWTKTNTGAGATVAVTSDGLHITSTLANNSLYTAPAAFWSPDSSDSMRVRWRTKVVSGGDLTADVASVRIAIGDGVNRQVFGIRFTDTQARLYDSGGTLWTASASASFQTETEWLLAFAHDYPSAGGGQISLWWRHAADTHWRTAVTAQAVAEEAGVATEPFAIGGNSVASASEWYITGPWWAPGSAQMDGGFTNPDDLSGRPAGQWPIYIADGMSVQAMGDAGHAGDNYTTTVAYTLGKANLVEARPSCYWQTASTSGAENVVGGDGNMPTTADTVALFGTNYRTATLQLNATDSWATPAQQVALEATLYSTTVSSSVKGAVVLTGANMRPGQYRSREGRRYYVQVKASNPVFFEITDNDTTTLYVDGLNSGYAGEMAYIFGDRMAATFSTSSRMYWRLVTTTDTTSDTYRRTGTMLLGVRHELVVPYGNGFVDAWELMVEEVATRRGYRSRYEVGPEVHTLRIAWDLVDRLSTDALWRVVDTFRAVQGSCVALWRDRNELESLGLYTVTGPPSSENAFGERSDALERLAQIRLTELA